MNKRYIDFVPTSGARNANAKGAEPKGVKASTASRVGMSSSNVRSASVSSARINGAGNARVIRSTSQVQKTEVVYRSMPEAPRATARRVKRGINPDDDLQLGVIEDLNTKFVSSEVEKKPLGSAQAKKGSDLKEVKSRRLLGRKSRKTAVKPVEKPVENSESKVVRNVAPGVRSAQNVQNAQKATYKMPKSPFINQDKVAKRPLSKNAYQRKVEVPEEKPSGPVAIIAKPEKDKKVSLVVTIIITIILGAAAGTVAFLLLPK
ncbi:MAG: hypothetical protein Q4A70_01600 [Candidatus Saccharibacteria bacterium]|nr:hypothetical protein [Candidatus Saccharibacteria bacterium]